MFSNIFFLLQKGDANNMSIYKRCSRCGKRLPLGSTCLCLKQRHKEYDKHYRDKRSKTFYDGKEWEAIRLMVLETDGGIDVYLFMTESKVVAADTVHHIIPLKDDWNSRNKIDNLISLHHGTHSMIEKKYRQDKAKMQQELSKMLVEYRKMRRGGAV